MINFLLRYLLDQSWHALSTKSIKNIAVTTNCTSIADCWNQAKNKISPFFQWNPSENGTCQLSKSFENATIADSVQSFAGCREVAVNRPFFWDADGMGTCYLLDGESSQICTSPAGSKCSKNKTDPNPNQVDGHLAVRTEFCVEKEFKPNQCDHITNGSKYPLPDHPLYECAKLDQDHCTFFKRCAFVKDVSESWAFNEFRTLKNNESKPAFSFSACWREEHNDTEFLSWDPKTKICSWSNENT